MTSSMLFYVPSCCCLLSDRAQATRGRLRKRLGVNKFSDVTATGEPDEDYLQPFSGLKGIKNALALYLMRLLH